MVEPDTANDNLLAEVDTLLEEHRARVHEAEDRAEQQDKLEIKFREQFAQACRVEIRPAMQAVLDRLRQDGGGGLIEVRSGGEPRFHNPSITLWMSLDGEIAGSPREDRHPYLRVDANVAQRRVEVRQGAMWLGAGTTTSGQTGTWDLTDITNDKVERTILGILLRAAK